MEARRRQHRNKLIIDIKSAENFIQRSNATIHRIKSSNMGIDYISSQIEKLKEAVLEKEELLEDMEDELSKTNSGDLDEKINENYKTQTALATKKHDEIMKIKKIKREEKKKDKDTSETYWKSVVSSARSGRQKERDIKYAWRYFHKVIDQMPDYMKRNLADMPNNKGYIWRGIHFYGEKRNHRGPSVMFEKRKGGILVIHETTPTEYRRYEKEGKNKKILVQYKIRKKKKLGKASIMDYTH